MPPEQAGKGVDFVAETGSPASMWPTPAKAINAGLAVSAAKSSPVPAQEA